MANAGKLLSTEKDNKFLATIYANPLKWAGFTFAINVDKDSCVFGYKAKDEHDFKPISSDHSEVYDTLQKYGKRFTQLTITFYDSYESAKEINKTVNNYCSQANQTVKLLGYIGEKFCDFTFKDAANVILERLSYYKKFSLHKSFPKMTALILEQQYDTTVLEKSIPHLIDLTIHFADYNGPRSDEAVIICVSIQVQLVKLAIFNRDLTFEQLEQLTALTKLNEVTFNWISENEVRTKIKEFLKCCLYLKRFSLFVNKTVRRNALTAFLIDLTQYFEGISKLQSSELKQDGLWSIAIFDLKVIGIKLFVLFEEFCFYLRFSILFLFSNNSLILVKLL